MATVRSFGALQRSGASAPVPRPLLLSTPTSLGSLSYREIYRQQPEVRVVIEFLARNIAQLGIHLFLRQGDTDRERDTAHPSIRLLSHPNPYTTRYRLIESTIHDLAIFAHAFWAKLRGPGGVIKHVLRLPPDRMATSGDLYPEGYLYTAPDGARTALAVEDVIHFRDYDPESGLRGVSALESLKGIVAESRAASQSRLGFWRGGARLGGVVERPADQPWTKEARDRWRSQFAEKHSGSGASGSVVILEDGMTFKSVTSTMADAEGLGFWHASREESARAYHVPLPMVGILTHATFSNIKEQHKNLYQDCLGPRLEMLTEDLELQLLPEWDDIDGRYLEFNIAAKLAGSFEEQASALQTSVGRPWLSVNEARARQNLPRIEGEDAISSPLNMTLGPLGTVNRQPTTASEVATV